MISVLANLMGPAIAVLILPPFGWRNLPLPQKTTLFAGLAASSPPSQASLFIGYNCDVSQVSAGNHSCAYDYATNLDAVLVDGSSGQDIITHDTDSISFWLNLSDSTLGNELLWVVNQQAMLYLSLDAQDASLAGFDPYNDYASDYGDVRGTEILTRSQYKRIGNALEINLQRRAPALLLSTRYYYDVDSISVIRVSDEKSVRCYNIPNPEKIMSGLGVLPDIFVWYPYPVTDKHADKSTMCIPTGSGRAGVNNYAQFSMAPDMSTPGNETLLASVYSSYRAAYLN